MGSSIGGGCCLLVGRFYVQGKGQRFKVKGQRVGGAGDGDFLTSDLPQLDFFL